MMKNIKVLGSGSPILDVLLKVDDSFLSSFVSGEKGGMNMIDSAEQELQAQAHHTNRREGTSVGLTCGVNKACGGNDGNAHAPHALGSCNLSSVSTMRRNEL